MAFTPITITGAIVGPDGSAAKGRITALLSETLTNGAEVEEPVLVTGELGGANPLTETGAPFVVAANDDAGTDPPRSFYTFTTEIVDPSEPFPVTDSFDAVVPSAAAGGTITLAALRESRLR